MFSGTEILQMLKELHTKRGLPMLKVKVAARLNSVYRMCCEVYGDIKNTGSDISIDISSVFTSFALSYQVLFSLPSLRALKNLSFHLNTT